MTANIRRRAREHGELEGSAADLLDRGMKEPKLIITNGSPGLCRAIKEVMPGSARQRCTAHKDAQRACQGEEEPAG